MVAAGSLALSILLLCRIQNYSPKHRGVFAAVKFPSKFVWSSAHRHSRTLLTTASHVQARFPSFQVREYLHRRAPAKLRNPRVQ
jgi:hypothetical protein